MAALTPRRSYSFERLSPATSKWLDVVVLSEALLKVQDPTVDLQMVKFFTAPALARFASYGMDSVIAQQKLPPRFDERHPGRFQLICGTHSIDTNGTLLPTYMKGKPYDKTLRSRVWKLEEKKTDVNIAMDMASRRLQGPL